MSSQEFKEKHSKRIKSKIREKMELFDRYPKEIDLRKEEYKRIKLNVRNLKEEYEEDE